MHMTLWMVLEVWGSVLSSGDVECTLCIAILFAETIKSTRGAATPSEHVQNVSGLWFCCMKLQAPDSASKYGSTPEEKINLNHIHRQKLFQGKWRAQNIQVAARTLCAGALYKTLKTEGAVCAMRELTSTAEPGATATARALKRAGCT
jgi:hypothetical protein